MHSKTPRPCFKYFINRSVVRQQYREALQLANSFKDPGQRESATELMRYELDAFRKHRHSYEQSQEVQDDIDYLLAKTRQRIS